MLKGSPSMARTRPVARWAPLVRLSLGLVLVAGLSGCDALRTRYLQWMLKDRTDHSLVTDKEAFRVILCGTGTPQGNSPRGQPCTLIAAGGMLFLFDAGEGSSKKLESLNVPIDKVSRVFITHWHSDHFNGLGGLVNHGWVWGRKVPVQVYGPPGVERVAEGLAMAYRDDVAVRHAHFVPEPGNARIQPHKVELPAGQDVVRVFDEGGVTIDAHRVAHEPVEPAYGYVVKFKNKKVFVSGDTRVSDVYLPAMKDADLVVHEAVNSVLVKQAALTFAQMGDAFRATLAEHVIGYHSETIELARMASKAGVKHLVLTHLIPAPDGVIARRLFVDGMSREFQGTLTLGEDGASFNP